MYKLSQTVQGFKKGGNIRMLRNPCKLCYCKRRKKEKFVMTAGVNRQGMGERIGILAIVVELDQSCATLTRLVIGAVQGTDMSF
jgi:hypothetical protein